MTASRGIVHRPLSPISNEDAHDDGTQDDDQLLRQVSNEELQPAAHDDEMHDDEMHEDEQLLQQVSNEELQPAADEVNQTQGPHEQYSIRSSHHGSLHDVSDESVGVPEHDSVNSDNLPASDLDNEHSNVAQSEVLLAEDSAAPNDGNEQRAKTRRAWLPITLRAPYLITMMILTCLLIAAIQWLFYISERDQGILFAPDINKLPLRKSFGYLYLPTIISVIYSFLWTWLDLDVRRLEPYFQLSDPAGCVATKSILLSYPMDFLFTLPFSASKNRHWSVFCSSMIVILAMLGLTPTQAGLFAVRTITVSEEVPSWHATAYTPISQQDNVSTIYAQSVYNIAWLNESLPPFMTREFALSKFGALAPAPAGVSNLTYATRTELYSMDVSCEKAVLWYQSRTYGDHDQYEYGQWKYNSTDGCSMEAPQYRFKSADASRPYDTAFISRSSSTYQFGYDLESSCNESSRQDFFVRWSRVAGPKQQQDGSYYVDPTAKETSLFCSVTFYQQSVVAKISQSNGVVLSVSPSGEKLPLPADLFNKTTFMESASISDLSRTDDEDARADCPTRDPPDHMSHLVDLPLNLDDLQTISAFAIATHQRPPEDYLKPETLRRSHEAAYQLLFARRMAELLGSTHDDSLVVMGTRSYVTQCVKIVPAFVYAATIVLAIILITVGILYVILRNRSNGLRSDPSTIGAIMTVVKDDPPTYAGFIPLDSSDADHICKFTAQSTFWLTAHDHNRPHLLRQSTEMLQRRGHSFEASEPHLDNSNVKEGRRQGVRPLEFKLVAGVVFLLIQTACAATFAVLFSKATMEHGLALPSEDTFVRQLTENYIPIAIATIMEPFWLMLNRMLGLLKPYDHLRQGNASGKSSIDLDYSSLPPQLLLLRALNAKHFLLGLVCFAVFLAQVLAVAFSSLMYEDTVLMHRPIILAEAYDARFRALNGTGLPFNTDPNMFGSDFAMDADRDGHTTSDQFYRLMSNLTANTPLPPWADEDRAYLPRSLPRPGTNAGIRFNTVAFEVDPRCRPLQPEEYSLDIHQGLEYAGLYISLNTTKDISAKCTDLYSVLRDIRDQGVEKTDSYLLHLGGDGLGLDRISTDIGGPNQTQSTHMAIELVTMLAGNESAANDLYCRQHFLAGWLRFDLSGTLEPDESIIWKTAINSMNETLLLCKPQALIGPAEVIVDSDGRPQEVLSLNLSSANVGKYFNTTQEDLVAQANRFMSVDAGARWYKRQSPIWHNDSFPSDFVNYLIKESTNDSTLLDASFPVPSPEHVVEQLSAVYKQLFAILIATNADLLFDKASEGASIPATMSVPETRILFSTPAFIIVELILNFYILVTIFFYARRPWRILPRLPSTIASTIAFFASSHAIKELAEVSHEDAKKTRASWRWAYGTFIGTDGKSHTGIEREPFVSLLREEKLPYQPRRREKVVTGERNEP